MGFDGLRVISLESRRTSEIRTLIERQGGQAFVAPSMRERPLADHADILRFLKALRSGAFDMVICMTGVGLAFLRDAVAERALLEPLVEGLRGVTVVARGPKPSAVLRQLGVPIHVAIPEPNTWREIVTAVALRQERRIAIQEYGRPNAELYGALEQMGAQVTPVAVYQWELPEDQEPLREAARRLAAGDCDVILFTSSAQLDHLRQVACELNLEGAMLNMLARRIAIASVGPVMSEALAAAGLPPDIVPEHPKMGPLVLAAAEGAAAALAAKRR